jgi:uncharacterized membrane protein
MEPVTAGVILVVVGVALIVLGVVLVRRWNRENRRRYPDRVSSHRFEINRKPRERK